MRVTNQPSCDMAQARGTHMRPPRLLSRCSGAHETVEALEQATVDGRRRVRCEKGWLTAVTADDVEFLRPVGKPRVAFKRGGQQYWVSTASAEGLPLLMPKQRTPPAGEGRSSSASASARPARRKSGAGFKGTRGERVAAHVREKEEHTSEEGIAVVNQALAEPGYELVRPALLYVAAAKSWELGFSGLWEYLGRWIDSAERRWNICSRVKGGLRDTSKLGGFCRDQAYWAGAVHYLRKRATLDLRLLHMGRINIDDATVAEGSAPESWPSASLDVDDYVLPPFLADLDDYKSKLDAIAAANFLDE